MGSLCKYIHTHLYQPDSVLPQAPAPKKKAQKSPVQRVASDEEGDDGMFAAVLSGRSALQVRWKEGRKKRIL